VGNDKIKNELIDYDSTGYDYSQEARSLAQSKFRSKIQSITKRSRLHNSLLATQLLCICYNIMSLNVVILKRYLKMNNRFNPA
jgi:hypothetical protein